MNHETASGLLLDLAYGELTPGDTRAVEAHLAGCEACRAERDRIAGTRRLMRGLGEEEAPGGEGILMAAARQAAERPQRRARVPLFSWVRLAAGLAVLMVVGGVTIELLSSRPTDRAEEQFAERSRDAPGILLDGPAPPRPDAEAKPVSPEPRAKRMVAPAVPAPAAALAEAPRKAAAEAPPRRAAPQEAVAVDSRGQERARRQAAIGVAGDVEPPAAATASAAAPATAPAAAEAGPAQRPAAAASAPAAAPLAAPAPPRSAALGKRASQPESAAGETPAGRAARKVARATGEREAGGIAGDLLEGDGGRAGARPGAALVAELAELREAGKLNEARRRPDPCPGGDTLRLAWFDGLGVARRFARTGPLPAGLGAGEATRDQYYDQEGRLRYAIVEGTGPEGRFRRNLLLDPGGALRSEDPAAARPWPLRDLTLRDPAAAFWAPNACAPAER